MLAGRFLTTETPGEMLLWERVEAKAEGAAKDEMVDSITDSVNSNLSKLWEVVMIVEPGMLQSMGLQRIRHNLATEEQQPADYLI